MDTIHSEALYMKSDSLASQKNKRETGGDCYHTMNTKYFALITATISHCGLNRRDVRANANNFKGSLSYN